MISWGTKVERWTSGEVLIWINWWGPNRTWIEARVGMWYSSSSTFGPNIDKKVYRRVEYIFNSVCANFEIKTLTLTYGQWSNELCGWKDLRLNKEGDFWQCKIISVPPALTAPNLLIIKWQYFSIGVLNIGRSLFQTLYLTTGLRMRYLSKFWSRAVMRGDPSPIESTTIQIKINENLCCCLVMFDIVWTYLVMFPAWHWCQLLAWCSYNTIDIYFWRLASWIKSEWEVV